MRDEKVSRDNVGSTPVNVLVMGAAGCGKSTVAAQLACELGCLFIDADDHHPAENIKKMAQGTPLTDEDRAPWLRALAQILRTNRAHGQVLACSALKDTYRSVLLQAVPSLQVFFLKVPQEELSSRLKRRHGHFFDHRLLDSQLRALEAPDPEQTIDGSLPIAEVVENILGKLNREKRPPIP